MFKYHNMSENPNFIDLKEVGSRKAGSLSHWVRLIVSANDCGASTARERIAVIKHRRVPGISWWLILLQTNFWLTGKKFSTSFSLNSHSLEANLPKAKIVGSSPGKFRFISERYNRPIV